MESENCYYFHGPQQSEQMSFFIDTKKESNSSYPIHEGIIGRIVDIFKLKRNHDQFVIHKKLKIKKKMKKKEKNNQT